jgi:hypothetical protein
MSSLTSVLEYVDDRIPIIVSMPTQGKRMNNLGD